VVPTNNNETPAGFDTQTLTQRVVAHLREEIAANRISPGERLREAELAARLGISRAPIREALRELAAEGWVRIVPRHGAVVTTLSRQEFLEAYQVREALEALAVRLAVPRLGPADFELLWQLHGQMVEASRKNDVDTYFTLNRQFHRMFVERSGNQRLRDTYVQLMEQMQRTRIPSLALRGGMDSSSREHEAILRAAAEGKVEEAAQLMAEHIRVPQRRIEELPDHSEWFQPKHVDREERTY